jgi:hypothetical protein
MPPGTNGDGPRQWRCVTGLVWRMLAESIVHSDARAATPQLVLSSAALDHRALFAVRITRQRGTVFAYLMVIDEGILLLDLRVVCPH